MSYKEFVRDLKEDHFHNVIMLCGKENYLIRWAVHQIIGKYAGKEFLTLNVREFQGDSVNMDEVIGMARTPALLTGGRVLIVRNLPWLFRRTPDHTLKSEGARLLEYAEGIRQDSLILLSVDSEYSENITAYGKNILKKGSGYTMETLSRPELRSFIRKRIHLAGKNIPNRTLEYLIDATGYLNRDSLYRLDDLEKDIQKICAAAETDEITDDLIDDLLIGDGEKYVFALMDTLIQGNKPKAMQMTENILQSGTGNSMQLIALLTSQFEMMLDAKWMEEKGVSVPKMAKALGVSEFRFRKAAGAARKFRKERLRDRLITLYNFDRDIKRGDIDKDTALELFIAGM